MAEYGGYAPRQAYQNAPQFRPQQPKAYNPVAPPPVVDAPGRPMGAPTCTCGQPAALKVAGPTAQNPGKEFLCCPNPKESSCGFFQWADGTPSTKRQRVGPNADALIPVLIEKIDAQTAKIETLLAMMSGNLNGPQSMAENFQQHQ